MPSPSKPITSLTLTELRVFHELSRPSRQAYRPPVRAIAAKQVATDSSLAMQSSAYRIGLVPARDLIVSTHVFDVYAAVPIAPYSTANDAEAVEVTAIGEYPDLHTLLSVHAFE